jgi:hypothetical protein
MTAPNPPYSDCPQCRAEDEAIWRLVTTMGEVIHGADPYLAARATFCVMSGCLLVMHADHREALIAEFPEALATTIATHLKSRQ